MPCSSPASLEADTHSLNYDLTFNNPPLPPSPSCSSSQSLPRWLQFSAAAQVSVISFPLYLLNFSWNSLETDRLPAPTCGQPPVLAVCRVGLGEEQPEGRLLSVRLLHVNVRDLRPGGSRACGLLLRVRVESPLELRVRLSPGKYDFRNVHGCNVSQCYTWWSTQQPRIN